MTDLLDILDENNTSDNELTESNYFLDNYDDDRDMNEEEARQITNAIKSAATATYILLSQAHKHNAYKALHYATWEDFVKTEFEMSPQRSYQLLAQSKVINEIEEATPDGTIVKLTEAQARDIKTALPEITERITTETADKTPEEASEIVDSIVDDIRQQKKEDDRVVADKQKKIADAKKEGYQDGLEAAADSLLEADRSDGMTSSADGDLVELDVDGSGEGLSSEDAMMLYNFFNALTSISSLPEPDDFVKIIPEDRAPEVENQLSNASEWLNRTLALWEKRNS